MNARSASFLAIVVATVSVLGSVSPSLSSAPRPHDSTAVIDGVTFPTHTNGCTGTLIGVFGASTLKDYIQKAARDYCLSLTNNDPAQYGHNNYDYDVEYAQSPSWSCAGEEWAANNTGGNDKIGVSTVFPADSCASDQQAAIDPSTLVDTVLGVNVVEEIATCPGAQQPNGGAVNPAGPTQCGAFSTDPGASGATSCSPAALSLAQATLLYNQQIGNERSVGGCVHSNAVQNRVTGSGTRITFCFNVFGPGTDNCQNEGSAQALAPTTGTEVNDVCGPTAANGNYAQGYVSRADVVADPRSNPPTGSRKTALQGCGVVTVGGYSGYNGSCDPLNPLASGPGTYGIDAAGRPSCNGDLQVGQGLYQPWGYAHLVLNNANCGTGNCDAADFANYLAYEEGAGLAQTGFLQPCQMGFERTYDAGPYSVQTEGCPISPPCLPGTFNNPLNDLEHSFIGNQATNPTVYGVAADITTHQPDLCTQPPQPRDSSDSSAWAALTPASDPGGCSIAQSGYLRDAGQQGPYGTQFQFFAEYATCGKNFVYKNVGSANPDSTHHYAEVYNTGTHRIDMQVDGVTVLSTNFDPLSAWGSTWNAKWLGETFNAGDNLAGSVRNPAIFGNLAVQTSVGGSFAPPQGLAFRGAGPSFPARYDESVDSPTQFHIWTKSLGG